MQLERSPYQSGSEPEVLTVRFTDSVSSSFRNGPMVSPEGEWERLAKETAKDLGIEMHVREMEDGSLAAAFKTSDDCNRLIAGMAPEWKNRLLKGLGYVVSLACRFSSSDRQQLDRDIKRIAAEYDLEPEDFEEMVQESLTAFDGIDLSSDLT